MSKKRSSEDVVEVVGAEDVDANKPKKKKTKEDKKKPEKVGQGDAAGPSVSKTESAMERKKKRKALDKKKKHHTAVENKESNPKKTSVENITEEPQAPSVSSKRTELPEFHISVFKDLASADDSVREAAVESLVKELQEVQNAYDKLENKELVESGPKLEAEKDDGLNNCAPSLRYAIRRLIRGVSSSRECARQGFALGLTVLVDTISSIKVDSLLKIPLEILDVSSSMKGQEVRDCLLGRLFVYGALSRTGRLVKEWEADKNTPLVKEFTSALISFSTKKRYLQEPAVCALLELVEKLPSEGVLTHVIGAPGVQEWFDVAAENGNPDALLLALKIREKTSASNPSFGKLLPRPFSPSKFFSSDHLSSLVNLMKESTFCQPRVHSVWPVIANMLLPDVILQEEDVAATSSSLKKHKKGRKSSSLEDETLKNLRCFCEVVIEGSLLLSSHDRKNLALDVILLLLPRLPASFIPIVLSYKVVHCLIDVLSTKDSWLYKVAQNFLKELSNWASSDDVRKVAVVMALQKNSNGKFDRVTQTRTIRTLVADFQSESGCMLFIQSLTNMFVDEAPSEDPSDQSQTTDDNSELGSMEDKDSIATAGSSDSLKSWVIESIPSVVRSAKLDSEVKCRVQKEALKFLAVQGLCTASLGKELTSFELQEKFRWPKAATSSALCKMCIEQIQSLLAAAQKGEGSHTSTSTTEQSDLGSYFIHFLSTLRNIPSVSLFRTLSDDDDSAFKKLQEMEIKLFREVLERNSMSTADSRKLHAFRYLLIQLLLQVLLRPGEFTEAASELIICCEKAFATTESPEDDEMDTDEAPEVIDVLVDTLLSLLPQSSASMRSAIEQVFKAFCSEVTEDGLRQMLRVIKKVLKPPRHQEADSDDDDEEDEDVLEIEEDEDEELGEAETGDTAESDGQTDDSEAVVTRHDENSDDDDDDEEDSEDEDMDDEAMFRMDTYLAKIFKERKNQGAGDESAHSQLLLFKLRVLSLLEIYLHENPGKAQVLTVYSNLVQAFITTEGSEQLSQRIWGILQKKIFKAKDYPKGESVQLSVLEPLLERNLRWASKAFKKKSANNPTPNNKQKSASWNRHKMITSLAENSTHWLLKIIDSKNLPEAELAGVNEILRGVIVGYFDSKKSQIKSEFLKEMVKRRPWIGRNLLGFILEKCRNAKSDFRRVEALGLIGEIMRQMFPSNTGGTTEQDHQEVLKTHLPQLTRLVEQFVTNMPKKQARRAEVRRFCGKLFQIVASVKLVDAFLGDLSEDARAACESQVGNQFPVLVKMVKE